MASPLITCRGTVYPWHCDHDGHMSAPGRPERESIARQREGSPVNVMWYAGEFDEATGQRFNPVGLTPSYRRQARRGMAAVDQHLSYLRERHAGDVVTVRTTELESRDKSIRFVHEMSNDETGEVAARTTPKGVHLDTLARRSCRFDEAIVGRAAAPIGGAAG